MNISAEKILQFPAFESSFEQELRSHYTVSPVSSKESSGSQYSQPESELHSCVVSPPDQRTGSSTTLLGEPMTAHLEAPLYNATERKEPRISEMSIIAPVSTLRTRDHSLKQNHQEIKLTERDSTIDLTNGESMGLETSRYACQEQIRFGDNFDQDMIFSCRGNSTNPESRRFVHRNLADRSILRVIPDNGKSVRNHTSPVSMTGNPCDGISDLNQMAPVPSQRPKIKRSFNAANDLAHKDSEMGETGQRLKTKFSAAMTRLSGGLKPPVKQTVISNRQRRPGGPDTPLPLGSGFKSFLASPGILEKGNEQWQDAVDKAKKSLEIRAAEKREAGLKKQITIIGLTDQCPGICSKAIEREELTVFQMVESPNGYEGMT